MYPQELHRKPFKSMAACMLSTPASVIPAWEPPERPAELAEFVEVVLRVLLVGPHVASPELRSQASQSDRRPPVPGENRSQPGRMHALVQAGLEAAHNRSQSRVMPGSENR